MPFTLKPTFARFLSLFVMGLTAGFLLLNSYVQLANPLFTNDFNAWLLPAVAPLNHLGMPYSDYWAIEPPALLFMTTIWGTFNQSMAWFQILNLLLQVGTCWLYWKVLNRVFPWFASLILYAAGCLLYFTPTVQSMFLPSEINGTFFCIDWIICFIRPSKINS